MSNKMKGIVVVAETVFQAFPNAIEPAELVKMTYSTIEGNVAKTIATIDVIIDEESSTDFNQAPNAQPINSNTLVYVKPWQVPTLDAEELQASFGIQMHGRTYSIEKACIGKNQETGIIEHLELFIKQRSTIDATGSPSE